MSKRECIYMIVTQDKYELPLFVGNIDEVAEWQGVSKTTVYASISRYEQGTYKGCRFRRVYGDMGTEC